jgi:hypothetical protein
MILCRRSGHNAADACRARAACRPSGEDDSSYGGGSSPRVRIRPEAYANELPAVNERQYALRSAPDDKASAPK